MEARELRIGNYLSQKSENMNNMYPFGHWRVDKIGVKSFQCKKFNSNNFVAIPLTEEWLLKLGFEKEVHGSISSSSTWFYLPDFPLQKAGGFANPMYYSLGNYKGIKIYTVHQLQNLYHALTGQELTLC